MLGRLLSMDRVFPPPALHHITTILKEQRSDIDEVLESIYDNINLHRADLNICIPELRNVLYGLLLEHLKSIKLLAASIPMGEQGQEYDTMVKILQQEYGILMFDYIHPHCTLI